MPVRKGPSTRRGDTRSDGQTDVKVPTGTRPGNRKQDIEWGTKHAAMGEFERIGEEEFGIPFGAQWRWIYLQEDFTALIPEEQIYVSRFANPCSASAYVRDREGRYILDAENEVLRRPCMRAAIAGGDVCETHGGKLTLTRAAARRRLEAASDLVVERLLQICFDPATDAKTAVTAAAQLLDRAGIKGGVEVDVNVPGWQEGLKAMLEGVYDGDK